MTTLIPSAMTRDDALALMHSKIESESLRKHMLASEAIMRRLAAHFGEDEDDWGLVGLLHDIDLESIDDDQRRHALVACEWLAELGVADAALQAIRAHNGDILGVEPVSRLDYALTSAESITGLVSATALVRPSRKVADVKVKSVRKRMKEKRFAANVSRERIRMHQGLGLSFDEFAAMAIEAMTGIADELGL